MTRTFIALELNQDLQSYLAGVIQQAAQVLPRIRWVDPSGIHLTLAFLGELDDSQLEQATQAATIAACQLKPFSYRLTHLGSFGTRVIWVGIEEKTGSLTRLHRILNHELAQRGLETDSRPFSPHLTLARIKSPLSPADQRRLQTLLADSQQNSTASPAYTVEHINVMKSELYPSGAQYTCLSAPPLKATDLM